MLVCPHDGAIDHQVFVVPVPGQRLEHPVPDPALCPAAEAPVHILPVAEPLRQVAPRHPGPVFPQHRLDEQLVVACWRSEEHTSELQSTNAHLVCRLLLEKKNIHTKHETEI